MLLFNPIFTADQRTTHLIVCGVAIVLGAIVGKVLKRYFKDK